MDDQPSSERASMGISAAQKLELGQMELVLVALAVPTATS